MTGALIDSYEAFIIDLDGVIYLLEDPIDGAARTIAVLQEKKSPFVFLTNNSASTPGMYVEKLAGLGINVGPETVITSAVAARDFMQRNYEPRGKRAFVIGERGLLEQCAEMGIEVVGPGRYREADFVLVGWDRGFDYEKLRAAEMAVRKGAIYIAMNTDATYPTPEGLWPGSGTMVAAVSTAAGQDPVASVGKPNPFIVEIALERLGRPRSGTLLVGDRLDTDIKVGMVSGMDTLLVLSGVSEESEIEASGARPTWIRKDISGLLE